MDIAIRARVQARILWFESGYLGDHKDVGGGIWEARLPFGPGYRVYFGKSGREIILLLLGGDKGTQTKDITRAKGLWTKYLEVLRHGKAK